MLYKYIVLNIYHILIKLIFTLRMQSIIKLLISVYKFIYITNLSMYIMYLKTQYFTRNKSEIDII